MKTLFMKVITLADISGPSFLDRILDVFESRGLAPEKIDLYEPIRQPYSREKARELWTMAAGRGEFTTGGILGKRNKPRVIHMLDWHRGRQSRVNHISVLWYGDEIFQNPAPALVLFKSLIKLTDAVFGYITEDGRGNEEHIPGVLQDRLPGVFWTNFYSRFYLEFLPAGAVKNAPWTRTEAFHNGLICTLGQGPEDPVIQYDKTMEIRRAIGLEYYGDPAIYRANVDSVQKLTGAPLDMRRLYYDDDPEHIGGPSELGLLAEAKPELKERLTPVQNMDETAAELAQMLTCDTGNPTPLLDRLDAAALDYSLDSARPLMAWLDIVTKSELKRKDRDRIILRAGAYLGEVLRRHTKKAFHWYDFDAACRIDQNVKRYGGGVALSAVLFEMKHSTLVYPMAKVEKYLDNGKSENLLLYLQAQTER